MVWWVGEIPIPGSGKSTDQTGGKASLPSLTYAPDSTLSRVAAAATGLCLALGLRRPAFSLLSSSSSSSSASKRYLEREERANRERGARESR